MPESGAYALLDGTRLAVFRTFDGELYALSNHDLLSGAHVRVRGVPGSREGVPTVASPMDNQVFDRCTGRCAGDSDQAVRSFGIRGTDNGDRVEVALS